MQTKKVGGRRPVRGTGFGGRYPSGNGVRVDVNEEVIVKCNKVGVGRSESGRGAGLVFGRGLVGSKVRGCGEWGCEPRIEDIVQ